MKDLFFFITGMVVGAIVALLLAPERGDDLRLQLQERAMYDFNRMQKTWKEDMAGMNDQISNLQSQLVVMQDVAREAQFFSSQDSETAWTWLKEN